MFKNTEDEYGSVAKFFHWLIFILITINIILGLIGAYASKSTQAIVIPLHKQNGLLILLLVFLRLVWFCLNIKPQLIATKLERFTVWFVHGLLYVTIIALPISGWIFSTAENHPIKIFGAKLYFPGIPISKAIGDYGSTVHLVLAWILVALVSIHILAALKHHFYDRDNVLLRMLPKNMQSKIKT